MSNGDIPEADSPKRTTTDEGTVEERSASDSIKLDTYKKATTKPPYGMTFAKITHRGTP